MIVISSVAQISLGQGLICTVSGSIFKLMGPCTVTEIDIEHNNSGAQPVNINLIDQSGNQYGPWSAELGSDNTWVVYPELYLLAGSYRLVDLGPGRYLGHAWVYGYHSAAPSH